MVLSSLTLVGSGMLTRWVLLGEKGRSALESGGAGKGELAAVVVAFPDAETGMRPRLLLTATGSSCHKAYHVPYFWVFTRSINGASSRNARRTVEGMTLLVREIDCGFTKS